MQRTVTRFCSCGARIEKVKRDGIGGSETVHRGCPSCSRADWRINDWVDQQEAQDGHISTGAVPVVRGTCRLGQDQERQGMSLQRSEWAANGGEPFPNVPAGAGLEQESNE